MKLYLDKKNNIPCYNVTKKDIKKVEDIYNTMFSKTDKINEKTVYDRKHSRIVGILGEVVFENIYPKAKHSVDDITYDFDLNEEKIDVKCKYRTVIPRLYYEASFFYYQLSDGFNADVYYFMSTIPDYSKVWICGYDTKENIKNSKHMEIWRAGQTDPSNGMKFRKNTVCIKYQYLKQLEI